MILKIKIKNLNRLKTLVLISFFCFAFSVLDIFRSSASSMNSDNPVDCFYSGVQKIFLHLNKDVYVTGEEVLFKGYLVNAANIPDTICKVVYVEIENSGNQKITGFAIDLFNGVCNSYFTLPDTLATGYYYVRAFTNQMRNFNHDYYFSAKILVANQADDKLEKLISDNYHNIDSAKVLFYTQNDNLLEGIENNILFKITDFSEDWDRQPVEIITDSGKIIASIVPNNKGIGDFSFVPEKDKNYFAFWNKKKFSLPPKIKDGFIIQTQQIEENRINVIIKSGTHELSDLLIFKAYNNSKCIFEKEFTMSNGAASFSLPAEKTKQGFSIFALFNSAQELICKKVYFVPDNSELIKINCNKAEFQPREKVILEINLKNKELINQRLNLSVNISQKGYSGTKNNLNSINTYLSLFSILGKKNSGLLESDSISEEQINKVLPVLNFPIPFSKSICQFLPENKGFIISGKVLNKSNIRVQGVFVFLSVADSFASLKYCISDSAGKFFFRLNRFYDNKNLIFQAKGSNNEPLKIEIEDKFNGELPQHIGFEYIPLELKNYLKYSQNIALTNKIYKPGLLSLLSENQLDLSFYNCHFYGIPDVTIYLSDYDELEDFKEIVRNILPGVYYNRSEKRVRVIDQGTQTLWPNEALVLLNNIPFPDPAFVAKLGSKQIKKIDLKKNHVIYGDIDLYGILSITTNQKNVYALNAALANLTFPNVFRNIPVILSGIDYGEQNNLSKKVPDLRQTLYWNPELKLSKDGKAVIEFYTSDLKGNYSVEIEGITSTGIPVFANTSIEVK